ncbi:DNA primase, partial [Candidatus Kuenenbacteria bacterium CG10_big_fil_rev_8_21_14_0_10_39_14]
FKARCPFHEEKTPSFMVNRERQFFHCFGCQESGDVFSFLQKMENIEFPEALKILANKAGVKLPEYNPQMANLKTRVLEMQAVAMAWFHNQLLNSAAGQKALSYLKDKRKLSAATIEEWQLGYALDSWDALSQYLKGKNFTHQEILQSGLVVPKERSQDYYDRFRDRVMFPIEDYHGNIVGFTGRTLKEDEGAKYINTPQTAVYNKSEVIFGLYKAKAAIKDEDQVVIVEGNMDVIASSGAKIKNVVAVSGTALTVEQIRILKRLTNDFIFAFDADQAGIRAAERSIGLAWSEEAKVKVIAINQSLGKDPDEIIRRDVALWKKLIAAALPAMDYFFEMKFRGYQPEEIESKKQVARDLLNLIIQLASPLEYDYYLKKLAEKLEVREEALREAVKKARQQKKPGVA